MYYMGEYGDTFNEAIAAELRAQRARLQISIDELAARTGFAKTTVINYMNNKRQIPVPAFTELCRALNIVPAVVFEAAQKAIQHD